MPHRIPAATLPIGQEGLPQFAPCLGLRTEILAFNPSVVDPEIRAAIIQIKLDANMPTASWSREEWSIGSKNHASTCLDAHFIYTAYVRPGYSILVLPGMKKQATPWCIPVRFTPVPFSSSSNFSWITGLYGVMRALQSFCTARYLDLTMLG